MPPRPPHPLTPENKHLELQPTSRRENGFPWAFSPLWASSIKSIWMCCSNRVCRLASFARLFCFVQILLNKLDLMNGFPWNVWCVDNLFYNEDGIKLSKWPKGCFCFSTHPYWIIVILKNILKSFSVNSARYFKALLWKPVSSTE